MSEEQLKLFLATVKVDAIIQEKLKATDDVDAIVAIAKQTGFDITAEELKRATSSPMELSDDDLENVAGGCAQDSCMITECRTNGGINYCIK